MKYSYVFFLLIFLTSFLGACDLKTDPNANTYTKTLIESDPIKAVNLKPYAFVDSVYVPIYSDIYNRSKDNRFPLTATLSIRNTSFSDTLVVNLIDYFDTKGDKVRSYLDHPIFLNPMASIDYVVDEIDLVGGSGANFIVVWSGVENDVHPLIQAIMVSTSGQQGVAFRTDGISIRKRK